MAIPMIVTNDNFESEVLKSETPVLVDFYADWCGPCKIMAPVIKELASEFEGRAKVAKLDVDADPEVAATYGIRSIPTLVVFEGGSPVAQAVGPFSGGAVASPTAASPTASSRRIEAPQQPFDHHQAMGAQERDGVADGGQFLGLEMGPLQAHGVGGQHPVGVQLRREFGQRLLEAEAIGAAENVDHRGC